MKIPRPSRDLRVTLTGIGALLSAVVLGGCNATIIYTNDSLTVVANSSSGSSGSSGASGSSGSSGSSGAMVPNNPPAAVMQAQSAHSRVDPFIVAADNEFGLALFQDLLSHRLAHQPNANISIAPLSVAMALQIAYNGAASATQQAMSQSLRLGGMTASQLNGDNAALEAALLGRDPQVQVSLANSLWTHLAANPIAPWFAQSNESYYGAMLADLSGAPNDINTWVANETQGLIRQIAPDIDYRNSSAVIASAAYFKGAWTDAFDINQTAPGAFTRNDGTQTLVMLMHQTASYPFFQGPNYQAIRLPYGQGHFSMLILLPSPGTDLSSFAAALTPGSLAAIVPQLQSTNVELALPRFRSGHSDSLLGSLKGLGMSAALCPAGSFPALANACISDVDHATIVEVDESGTVAAGATTIPLPTIVVTQSIPMSVDRPFLYAIRDDDDGELLLLIGALMDP
jgi:serine protease inhibitor